MAPSIPQNFRELSEFCAIISPSDLTATQINKAKDHIADTLACGTGGICSVEGQRALSMMTGCGENGPVPVWGSPVTLTARAAAFCNGVSTHAFELDDTDGCDHSGAVVIPAAMSALCLADHPVSGPDFIAAVVAGYEVGRRVQSALGGYWPHNRDGWHSTATCGTFGAAVTAARIFKLSPQEMGYALGHAASFSGGLWSFIHDASQTKRIHAGKAAEGGLTAALLAKSGLTGPTHIFEDSWGSFLKTFAPGHADAHQLTEGLGEVWAFDRAAIKPYASCRSTHAAADALKSIMGRRGLCPTDIQRIDVAGPAGLNDMCGGRDLSSMASAQMSLPYALAVLTEFGGIPLAAYTSATRGSDLLHKRMELIKLTVDNSIPASAEPTVMVALTTGEEIRCRVDTPLGSPENPLSDTHLQNKLMEFLQMSLSGDAAKDLLDTIADMDGAADIRDLPGKMRSGRLPSLFQ